MMNKIKQTGFSIVELLIAMVISLTLIFACASVYSSLRNSINASQGLSNAQESLRTAHYLMSRSIRQGYGLEVSGAAGTNQKIIVTYGEKAASNVFYGCLGEPQGSGATDTFYVKDNKHLYCSTKDNLGVSPPNGDQIIALDVQSLSASIPTVPANQKGVDVTLKIEGMPSNMFASGFTFSIAMRQRILRNAGESNASATSL